MSSVCATQPLRPNQLIKVVTTDGTPLLNGRIRSVWTCNGMIKTIEVCGEDNILHHFTAEAAPSPLWQRDLSPARYRIENINT